MSKKRRLKRKVKKGKQRDDISITKRSKLLFSSLSKRSPDKMGDDRRRFSPLNSSFPKRLDGRSAKLILSVPARQTFSQKQTKAKISFANPQKVSICRKRKARRESLFALSKVGKGRKVSKRRRRNSYSNIKC